METLRAILRIAQRLAGVGVITPILRIAATGEPSPALVALAVVDAAVVGVLLYLAYRMERR